MYYSLKISVFPKCDLLEECVTLDKLKEISNNGNNTLLEYKISTDDCKDEQLIIDTLKLMELPLGKPINYTEVCSDFTHKINENIKRSKSAINIFVSKFLAKRIDAQLKAGSRLVLSFGEVENGVMLSAKETV